MIYTVGYQQHSPESLRALMDALHVDVLIDVRSSPSSRKKGFSRKSLQCLLGTHYEWRGDRLGGRGKGPTANGLAELETESRTVLLMCMEHLPGDCHRYHAIAAPLAKRSVECWHVVGQECIETKQVARALASSDCRYDCASVADMSALASSAA